jgi:dipeptidase E
MQPNTILTSSFHTVFNELRQRELLPKTASVAFIPTAGDPYSERPWIDADREALNELGYDVTDIDLKNTTKELLEKKISSHDIIFVAGGNTTYLAQHSCASGFVDLIRDFLRQGKLYIGSSAGSILAGPTVEPFMAEDLADLPNDFVLTKPFCLHLVNYVVLPHDQVTLFSEDHDRIIKEYGDRCAFVRLTDQQYRVEHI